MAPIRQIVRTLLAGGLPDNEAYEMKRRVAAFTIITGTVIFFALLYGIVAAIHREVLPGIVLILNALFLIACMAYARHSKRYTPASITVSIGCMLLLLFLLITGGSNNTGPLWFYIFPLAVLFLNGTTRGIILLFILFASSMIVLFIPDFPFLYTEYTLAFKTRFFTSLFAVSVVSCVFEYYQHSIEQKIAATHSEMQETVDKLKNMQAQLVQSEKLASMGQLAAGVAHEINNPVGFVSSNSTTLVTYIKKIKEIIALIHADASREEVMKREKELKLPFVLEDIDDLLHENIEGLTRITEIVQNLKDFARVGAKEEFVEANINDCLENTLLIAKNEIKYHADVKKEFGSISTIECHIGGINQVFLNILVNAAQAIKSQDRKNRGLITVKTYDDNDSVFCAISDNGPGIPQENLLKIFDPFYTTKEVGEGTGLGLSISYDIIVNKHKGNITVQSETGSGTTFFIKLPKSQDRFNA